MNDENNNNLFQKVSPLKNTNKKSASLVLYITLLYILLTVVNIVFFTVMIFENQMDLMVTNFKFHSENLINSVLYELEEVVVTSEKDENLEKLTSTLITNGIDSFLITDSEGKIIHEVQNQKKITLPPFYDRKIKEIKNISTFMKSRYNVELNSENFTVQFILPLKSNKKEEYYLYTVVSIQVILDRLKLLYLQLALAVTWGIVFHFVFALFVYRLIFRRLNRLEEASIEMASGNLKARADWQFKRNDELDTLGKSFNQMADKIEQTVSRLTDINDQMQLELEVGKQVQELFLPTSNKIFKDFNIATYFRPMREVSGDVYNYYKFSDKLQTVFLADATGHGVSAALVTAVIMNNLNNLVQSTYIPGKLMHRLNVILYEALQSAFYATSVMFLFDRKGNVYFTNAGHNPPLFIDREKSTITRMFASDTILGLDDRSEYKTHKITTKPGDRFLFYTDGLVEAPAADGKMFSLEKVEELIMEHFNKSNKEIVDILQSELANFAAEYKDDVTFILLEIPEYEP